MAERPTIAELQRQLREEAAMRLRRVAEPVTRGETVKAQIARAALRLGWKFSRAEDIWRGEVTPKAVELEQLRNWPD